MENETFQKLFWIAIATILIIAVVDFFRYEPTENYKDVKICEYYLPLFNMTEAEFGCKLEIETCEPLVVSEGLNVVDACTCPTTGTKVFRYCPRYSNFKDYIGSTERLKTYVIEQNPKLKEEVHWEIN